MFFKLLMNALKRRKTKMADEQEVKEKVENENNEVKEEKSTEPVEENNGETKETEQKEVENVEQKEETTELEENPTEQVQETQPNGNGIRVEDLVTKDMLAERLSALEAKFDAVVKENEDLKNALSQKSDELNGMKDKYENKNFGNIQKQGIQEKDKYANSTFDEYSKQFM